MPSARKLLVLLLLYIAGNILASVAVVVVGIVQGVDLADMTSVFAEPEDRFVLRAMLWIQALCVFILPALVFAWIYYRGKIGQYFRIDRAPALWICFLAVVVMLAGQSLVLLSYELNNAIPLPEWMVSLEQNAAAIMDDILDMQSTGAFILTFILVAILPAIGEELVFRGIVQRELGTWFKSEIAAIWVTAIIFSAIHMQFEGFLPRMVLGALLGYLYYWSGNLWIPILGHLVNNGIPVAVLYYTGTDLTQVDAGDYPELNVWSIVLSVVVLFFASEMIRRKSRRNAKA